MQWRNARIFRVLSLPIVLPWALCFWVILVWVGQPRPFCPCTNTTAARFGGYASSIDHLREDARQLPHARKSRKMRLVAGTIRMDTNPIHQFIFGASAKNKKLRSIKRLQLAAGSFTFVCMQPGCNIPHTCASATAIRHVGGWAGSVYVITDNPISIDRECQVPITVLYAPARDTAGVWDLITRPLQILPASSQRTVLMSTEVVVVGCLDRFLAYLAALKPELSLSVAPGDTTWFGRQLHAGIIVHTTTEAAQACSVAWSRAAQSKPNLPPIGAASSLLKVEGDSSPGGCKRLHRLPKHFFLSMSTSRLVIWAKRWLRRPVFALYRMPDH